MDCGLIKTIEDTENLQEHLREEFKKRTQYKWFVDLDFKIQLIMLTSFKYTSCIGYCPEIIVEPDKNIISLACNEKKRIENEIRKRVKYYDLCYVPDLLGFYRCREHYGGQLPSGIYLFIDGICNEAKHHKIDVNTLTITVFFHEFAHMLIHTVAKHTPAKITDERNFEELFCELFAYFMTFEHSIPRKNKRGKSVLKILEEDIEIYTSCECLKSCFSKLLEYTKQDKKKFIAMKRFLPYEWFNFLWFNEDNLWFDIFRSRRTRSLTPKSDMLALTLAEKALDGVLATSERKLDIKCDKVDVFLIDCSQRKELKEYSKEEIDDLLSYVLPDFDEMHRCYSEHIMQ